MLFAKVSLALNSVFFIQTEVLDIAYLNEVTLEWKTLKKLTASGFLEDLISTFVLTLLRFLRKLFLCFETKISIKKHVFWSKKFVVSDNDSFEQCADGPEVDEFT